MNFIATLLVTNLLNFSPADTNQYQLVVGSYTKKEIQVLKFIP